MKVNRRKMAASRIEILMQKAEEAYPKDKAMAHRYAAIAKRLLTRHNAKFPAEWKRRVCKKCGKFLVPGDNCRVRTHKSRITITCLECEATVRIPFK
jgi:ribonuclease P protein subunit RPR2